MFDFKDKNKRAGYEKQLSLKFDQAYKAQDWSEVKRLNALIEKCWLMDDTQEMADPFLLQVMKQLYIEWVTKKSTEQ